MIGVASPMSISRYSRSSALPTSRTSKASITEFPTQGFYPKPVQKPYPPVWVGGYSTSAIRRAARLGDGWHPGNIGPEALAKKVGTLRSFCEEFGRDPDSVEICPKVNSFGFGDVDWNARDAVVSIKGTAQQMVDVIRRYEEAGASHIVLGFRGGSIEEVEQTAERFAGEVRSRL